MAPGACVEEPPSAGDRHQVVFIDPGHGGTDPGTVGETTDGKQVDEKQVTLVVATLLAQRLRADGYTVVLSRTGDSLSAQLPADDRNPDGSLTPDGVRTDLEARVACANSAHAAVLLALHFNGFDDPTAGGSTTFYDPDRPFADRNLALAQAVQSAVVGRLQQAGADTVDRGVESDGAVEAPALTPADAAYLHFIELGPTSAGVTTVASAMPGALVEPLFLTNPTEAEMAASADGQQAIATGLSQGIETFLGG